MLFSELPLHEQVLEGTRAAQFESCMPVQEKVLPISIEGGDVMVQSKTGSGKTAVYIITFLEKYLRAREEGRSSACLIIAPTRELAQQINDDALLLCSKVNGFHIGVFYGGVGYEHQRKLLNMGCDLYIGTPGRLIEFMERRELDTGRIDTFVVDEADRLFDMGFYPDIKKMFRMLPDKSRRQTLLFSATLEMRVRDLAWEFMNDPAEVDLEPDHITVDSITQELYHIAKSDKFKLFLQLLKRDEPQFALVFTNSRRMAEEICARLRLNGYNADYLTGDLPQNQRQKALDKLKEGRTNFLVATDVAARGLQIDDLPMVFNYDIPEDYENYVHRIGRTARAGKSGKAVTFADEEFVYGLEYIEKYIKMKIPVIWPDDLPEIEDQSLGKSWRVRPDRPERSQKERSQRSRSRKDRPQNDLSQDGCSQKPRHGYSKDGRRPGGNRDGRNMPSGIPETDDRSRRDAAKLDGRRDGSNQDGPRQDRPRRTCSADRTNTKSLGAMTEDERMAYYRKKYGFVPKDKPEDQPKVQRPSQKSSKIRAGQAKKAEDSGAVENSKSAESSKSAKPERKEGFFKRLFGRKK